MMMTLSVEEALRTAEDKAALLRFMAEAAAMTEPVTNKSMLNGLASVCDDIEELIQRSRKALDATALGQEFRR